MCARRRRRGPTAGCAAPCTRPDIVTLAELIEAGTYRPVVDRTYALEDIVDAHRFVETHQKTGNVVVTAS